MRHTLPSFRGRAGEAGTHDRVTGVRSLGFRVPACGEPRSDGVTFLIRLLFLTLALASTPARAGLTPADLSAVAVAPAPGARVPPALRLDTAEGRTLAFGDALSGRPALLLPVDPTCRAICGPALSVLSGALGESGLVPVRDVTVLLVAMGGRDAASARAFAAGQASPALLDAGTLFTGPPEAVTALLDAVGYRIAADGENDAVAHPSAFLALTADGRVSRVLSSLALNPVDLRLAVVEAGEGRVGDLGDRLRLLCYGFDPVHGVYTARITTALRAAGLATVAALAAGLVWLSRRRRAAPGWPS